jgi:hypothetical protein
MNIDFIKKNEKKITRLLSNDMLNHGLLMKKIDVYKDESYNVFSIRGYWHIAGL